VKEGMALADVAKKGVQAVYSLTGEMPKDNEAAGIPPANKIVSTLVKEVTVKDGAITLVFGNNAHKGLDGKKLTIRPAVVPGEGMVPISWVCANVQVPKQMDAKGRDETDIQMSWLPADCRGNADPTKK
jgi:type IV pilus assembly protein PilA